jgi:hypothetical protein
MLRTYVRFCDEPWTTVLACALLVFPIAMVLLIPTHLSSVIGPRSLQILAPFVLLVPGIAVLRRIRAPDTLVCVFLFGAVTTAAYVIAACFTALTGFTFSRYNPHVVPRLAALNYVYVALIASSITIFGAMYYQKRLREIDR